MTRAHKPWRGEGM